MNKKCLKQHYNESEVKETLEKWLSLQKIIKEEITLGGISKLIKYI